MKRKSLLALAAGALLLGGCATGYYDTYGYDDGYYYSRPYGYAYGPAYYPRYYGPSVGFSLAYSDRGRYYRRY